MSEINEGTHIHTAKTRRELSSPTAQWCSTLWAVFFVLLEAAGLQFMAFTVIVQ